jgi:hypothetical protein
MRSAISTPKWTTAPKMAASQRQVVSRGRMGFEEKKHATKASEPAIAPKNAITEPTA